MTTTLTLLFGLALPAAADGAKLHERLVRKLTGVERKQLEGTTALSLGSLRGAQQAMTAEKIRRRTREILWAAAGNDPAKTPADGEIQANLSIGCRAYDERDRAPIHDYIEAFIKSLAPHGVKLLGSMKGTVVVPVRVDRLRDPARREPPPAVTIGERSWPVQPFWPNGAMPSLCPAGGLSGELVYVGRGEWEELRGLEMRGSIALMNFEGGRNWARLHSLGARAVVVVADEHVNREKAERLFCNTPVPFPRFYVDRLAGEQLREFAARRVFRQATESWEAARGQTCRLTGGNLYEERPLESLFAYLPPTKPTTYTVEPDDLLRRVALEFAVRLEDLKSLNAKDLAAGGDLTDKVLYIPGTDRTYRVAENDLIRRLERHYGLEKGALLALPAGSKLPIRAGDGSEPRVYVVAEDDLLQRIAESFGVTLAALKADPANAGLLASGAVLAEKELSIPGKGTYKVSPDDLLRRIEQQFSVSLCPLPVETVLAIPNLPESILIQAQIDSVSAVPDADHGARVAENLAVVLNTLEHLAASETAVRRKGVVFAFLDTEATGGLTSRMFAEEALLADGKLTGGGASVREKFSYRMWVIGALVTALMGAAVGQALGAGTGRRLRTTAIATGAALGLGAVFFFYIQLGRIYAYSPREDAPAAYYEEAAAAFDNPRGAHFRDEHAAQWFVEKWLKVRVEQHRVHLAEVRTDQIKRRLNEIEEPRSDETTAERERRFPIHVVLLGGLVCLAGGALLGWLTGRDKGAALLRRAAGGAFILGVIGAMVLLLLLAMQSRTWQARKRVALPAELKAEAAQLKQRMAALDKQLQRLAELRDSTLEKTRLDWDERISGFLSQLQADEQRGANRYPFRFSEFRQRLRSELVAEKKRDRNLKGNREVVQAVRALLRPDQKKQPVLGWRFDLSAATNSLVMRTRAYAGGFRVADPAASHGESKLAKRYQQVLAYAADQANWPEDWALVTIDDRLDYPVTGITCTPTYPELWAAADVALLSIGTVNDEMPALDTPRDVPADADFGKIAVQARNVLTLMKLGLESASDSLRPASLAQPKFGRLVGQVLQFNVRSGVDAQEPVPGTYVYYPGTKKKEDQQAHNTSTYLGVRKGIVLVSLLSGSYRLPVEVRDKDLASVLYAYRLNRDTALFDKVVDEAQVGTQRTKPTFTLNIDGRDTLKNLVLARQVYPLVIFPGPDPVDYFAMGSSQQPQNIKVADAVSNGEPEHYAFDNPSQKYGEGDLDANILYMPPQRWARATVRDYLMFRMLLVGPLDRKRLAEEAERPRGTGYWVGPKPDGDRNVVLPMLTPLAVARDMLDTDAYRYQFEYVRHGVRDLAVEAAIRRAEEKLADARSGVAARDWLRANGAAREAWGILIRSHARIQKLGREAVFSAVILMALLVPASAFLERLILARKSILAKLAGTVVIFVLCTALLKLCHPGFSISVSPFVVVIAFTMILMAIIVLLLSYQRFEVLVRRARHAGGEVESEEIGLISSLSTALTLGVSNLRRRLARTFLTVFTVTVLTFSILTFVSVRGQDAVDMRAVQLDADVEGAQVTPQRPAYHGVLFREFYWVELSHDFESAIRSEFGNRYEMTSRAHYIEAEGGNNADREGINQIKIHYGKKVHILTGIMAFEPNEIRFSHLHEAVRDHQWFCGEDRAANRPADRYCTILPDTCAEALGLKVYDDAGRVLPRERLPYVTFQDQRWKVIGILDAGKADRIRDITGHSLAMIDYLRSGYTRNAGGGDIVNEQPGYHVSWNRLAIIPYAARSDVKAKTRSVAIRFRPWDDTVRFRRDAAMRINKAFFGNLIDPSALQAVAPRVLPRIEAEVLTAEQKKKLAAAATRPVPAPGKSGNPLAGLARLDLTYEQEEAVMRVLDQCGAVQHIRSDILSPAQQQALARLDGPVRSADALAGLDLAGDQAGRARDAFSEGIARVLSLITTDTRSTVTGLAKIIVPVILCILIVLNTMMANVEERRAEVEMLGAVGLSPAQISFLLLSESAVFSVLGIVFGTFAGLMLAYALRFFPVLTGLSLNFASLLSLALAMGTGLVVLLATLIPARKAAAMAAPSGMANWVLPEPSEGGTIRFDLPFTLTRGNAVGMMAFFRQFLLNHADTASQDFNCRDIRLAVLSGEAPALHIAARMWLAPYDLDVAQQLSVRVTPTENPGVYGVRIGLRRTSGTEEAWLRTNYAFMDLVRHQFLLWRNLDNASRMKYIEQGAALFQGLDADRSPPAEASPQGAPAPA